MNSSSRLLIILVVFFGITLIMMDCARRMKMHAHAGPPAHSLPVGGPAP